MSTRVFTAALTAALGIAIGGAPRCHAASPAPAVIPDDVILRFKDGSSTQACDALLAALGAQHSILLGRTRALLVHLATPTSLDVIARWSGDPALDYIEPNFVYRAPMVPNDPSFSQQWALFNTGQTGGTPGADSRATEAWDLATGSPGAPMTSKPGRSHR